MMVFHYLLALLAVWGVGCASEKPAKETDSASPVSVPVVNDERNDLVLSWFADGGSSVASSVKDIPEDARREVRVQDPTILPEKRDPTVMFIADLRTPRKDGTYPVKTVKRADWEAKRRAALEAARKKAAAEAAIAAGPAQAPAIPSIPSGAAPVIMYSTKHCPVCMKARRWLLDNKIPYTEYDIEKDQAAAKRVQEKGAAQNIPTSGVPIFEIGGRLIPGFDPGAIAKVLAALTPPQQTI
jgi:glutaredoxin